MNFLAHLFLSCDGEDLLIGNFIADFIRNNEVSNYSLPIQEGIRLHRKIDTFTDSHPLVKQSVKRLQPFHNKYAPVVIDIIFDHLLANNWNRYSSQSLGNFAKNVYEILNDRKEDLPLKLKQRLPGMIQANWLEAYGTNEGILFTLRKMDERTSFPSNFSNALTHLNLDYNAYNIEFQEFFPELIEFVDNSCKC
jgi:acyl carrier protein phosphodiesterase